MNALIRAAADLQAFCDAKQWRFRFIGGLAVLRWGEPRETIDVDLTLITGFGREREFASVLLEAFAPRIDDAVTFAERNRVLLLRATSGVGLDIAFGGLPFEGGIEGRPGIAGASRADTSARRRVTAAARAPAIAANTLTPTTHLS